MTNVKTVMKNTKAFGLRIFVIIPTVNDFKLTIGEEDSFFSKLREEVLIIEFNPK